jgi:hypothetical protein
MQVGTGAGAVPKHDRTWLYAVVGALLALGGGGAWMLTRHQEIQGLGQSVPTLPPAAVEKVAPPAEAARPAPVAEPAIARMPVATPIPAGTAPVVPPPAVPVQQEIGPGPAPDSASWKALSRASKSKTAGGHKRRARAAAEAADGDAKEKAAAPSETQKADPFAE